MKELQILVKNINQHDAVNNAFYRKWMNEKLSLDNLAVFAINYWKWTFCFPEALASLIGNTTSLLARVEYTKTLYSEMGNGSLEKVHSTLFSNFCRKLAEKLESPACLDIDILKKSMLILPETENLIQWQKEIAINNYAMAAGAQLALEWQAYTMIRKLYEGARNYMNLWGNEDEFHEACEFFYVHIGSAEKDHKDESIDAAADLVKQGARVQDIELGFNKNLKLIADFWNGIAKSCGS